MVVDGPGGDRSVQPGSRVTVRYSDGRRREFRLRADDDRIVLPALDIPADSPIATALLGRRAGDLVRVELESGVELLAFTVERVV
jgi:transcription elongation GreA/GreB family factor